MHWVNAQVKILLAHNYYQQAGGEDRVFESESCLLEKEGHQVIRYTVHNNQIANLGSLKLAEITLWNKVVYKELKEIFRKERPQIAHFHNTFPLISPSAYYAAKNHGIPIVQTLHNYRLLCPNAQFFRNGKVCEDCLGKSVAWPGLIHACYRGSRIASGGVVAFLTVHRALHTWIKKVDTYIALTQFARNKFVEGGFPYKKIAVKPNFVYPDPGIGRGDGGFVLYVGRLTQEKGISTLLKAWEILGERVPLKIVGTGPLADDVSVSVKTNPGITWLGTKSISEVYDLMGQAKFLIFPSEWYETFGLVIAEAFAKGTPVIAANIGAAAEIVQHGKTGLHFNSGDINALVQQVAWLFSHEIQLGQMRKNARAEYEQSYSIFRNYQILMQLYETLL